MGIFSCQNVFLKSNWNQLTWADIGPEFANLTKIKHMGHVFHSVLGPEFEFEGKNNNFTKKIIYVKLLGFDEILEVLLDFGKVLYLPSNSSSRLKTEWRTCTICLILTKVTNSGLMSADISWYPVDFKKTFRHEKMPVYIAISRASTQILKIL